MAEELAGQGNYVPFNEALRQVVGDSPVRTQERLAAVLGVDQRTVSRYYTGENIPTCYRVMDIEDACGLGRGVIYAMSGIVLLPGVIQGDPLLTDPARQVMLAAYSSAVQRPG